MRTSRPTGAALVVALGVVFGVRVSAHRLDEFLQAARIDIEPDRVRLEISLTPGVSVTDRVIGEIDADRNGVLSREENQAYAGRVVSALTLRLDDSRLLPFVMIAASVPDVAALRSGDGAIVIRAEAGVPPLQEGPHRMSFHNGNAAEGSVYLANALVPEDDNVAVTAQQHVADQRALAIEFAVRAAPAFSGRWAAIGLAGLFMLAVPLACWRRRWPGAITGLRTAMSLPQRR